MKLLLLNNEGQPVASFDDLGRYDVRSPAQVFALLDLLELLLQSAQQDRSGVASVDLPSLPAPALRDPS